MMHTRTKQRKTCNIFHLSLKIKGLTAVNSSHSSSQLPWLGSHLSKMKRRESPPATRVLSNRIHTWTNLENLVEWTPMSRTIRPANFDNSAWTSWFFTFSHGLMTRLPVSRFFGKQKFCGEWYCLVKPWWHFALSFVPSDLFPSLL